MEDPNLSRNASSSRAIPVKKMIQDVEADPAILFDKLAAAKPMHASPFEHQATPDECVFADSDRLQWRRPHEHANFVGWRQHRKMLPGECA